MDESAEIVRALGRIEGQLGELARKIDLHHERMNAHSSDMDALAERVNRVENRQFWFAGAAAALGAVLGALGRKLGL